MNQAPNPVESQATARTLWLVAAGITLPLIGAFCWAIFFAPGSVGSSTRQAKALVARDLKDPSSAQFREVRRTGPTVCGEVNAKNSYGAYTGFKRFYVADGTVTREPTETGLVIPGLPTDAETFDLGWRINCGPQA